MADQPSISPVAFDIRFAQELCELLAGELGFVCNFMDFDGRIVASSVRERIGNIHPIAARIMHGEIDEYAVTADEATRSGTMLEGMNMGIDHDGRRVVCFSIAGPLSAVRPIAKIVRFCVASAYSVHRAGEHAVPSHAAIQPVSTTDLQTLLGQAQIGIEASLTQLGNAIDNIDQGITLFDPQLRLVAWNRRFLELGSITAGSIGYGTSVENVVHAFLASQGYPPGTVEQLAAKRARQLACRQTTSYQKHLPNGRVIEIADHPLDQGGWISTYTDVTDRIRDAVALREANVVAEAKIREQTARLREFAELSSDWFWEQDDEFRFTKFYGRAIAKLSRRIEDFMGKRRWELPLHGVSAQSLAEHIATCEQHRPFRDFAYEIPDEQGSHQYFLVSGTPVFDDHGNFCGYRGTGRNITDQHRAELAIRESERRLQQSERMLSQIVDGTSIATFVIDANHRITHWNKACTQLTAMASEDMLGQIHAWRAFYPTSRPTMADLIVDSADDATLARCYGQYSRSSLIPGGIDAEALVPGIRSETRWLYIAAAPLLNAQGEVIGAIETIQDITERRREQQLLEERTGALQQANAEMELRIAERTAQLSEQLILLEQLFEAIPGPVFYKNAEGRYLGCNTAFSNFIGFPPEKIIGHTAFEIAPRELAEKYDTADAQVLRNGGTQIYEGRVRGAAGDIREVMFHKAALYRTDGAVNGMVGLMLDITDRRRMEDELRQAATVFESCADGVMITRADNQIVAVNRAFTEITGFTEQEAIGRNPRFLRSGRHDQGFYTDMWASIAQHGRWQGEVWNRRKNGGVYAERISIVAIKDKQGAVANYVATFSDITHQKESEEKIQQLAFSDPLTGLPNRRLLIDRLQQAIAIAERNDSRGALLYLDLDGFKDINDTRGHELGDALLCQVAERIKGGVRQGDTVARFGGDEFVVMLEGLSPDSIEACRQIAAVGKSVIARMNEPFKLNGLEHICTPSIGAALFDGTSTSVTDLLRQADMAMYQVKESGKNALRFFDPAMQTAVLERVGLESELREAIRQGQFVLNYQPQVNDRGVTIGAEALVRWNHPKKGLLAPSHFIALAEQTGLIVPLGAQVISMACAQIQTWERTLADSPFSVAINISPKQFRDPHFIDHVRESIASHGIDPRRLKIEVTESSIVEHVDDAIQTMETLKQEGISFSLDDFGTGYSSLTYLHRLPFDQIKIDQSFVRNVLSDDTSAAIVRTIVALSRNLNIAVIAEGVETDAQFQFLDENGCHCFQGYLFGKPIAPERFMAFIPSPTPSRLN